MIASVLSIAVDYPWQRRKSRGLSH